MNCKTLVIELENYLDKELDPALRASIEEHLLKCKKCRVIVNTTKKTIEIYCNSEPAPLPEETRSRLHEALVKRLRRAHT
ncbi:MAG TPA: zf-HC2 domain-containing protein [Candidatus Limnocylindrales bacterium]|nr:zf-HC2 domain-containing protein [Candidatus Limnocylindrales bacterium]